MDAVIFSVLAVLGVLFAGMLQNQETSNAFVLLAMIVCLGVALVVLAGR